MKQWPINRWLRSKRIDRTRNPVKLGNSTRRHWPTTGARRRNRNSVKKKTRYDRMSSHFSTERSSAAQKKRNKNIDITLHKTLVIINDTASRFIKEGLTAAAASSIDRRRRRRRLDGLDLDIETRWKKRSTSQNSHPKKTNKIDGHRRRRGICRHAVHEEIKKIGKKTSVSCNSFVAFG